MEAHLVGVGIDTLKINVKYLDPDGKLAKGQELPDGLAVLFEAWQEKARATGKPLATSMTFHEARMTMLPNGAQAWKYIIKNDWLQLALGPRLKIPMVAKVTLSSAYLWKVGVVSEAVDEVHGFLFDVFGTRIYLQGGQIDLCVDLVGLTLPSEWEQVFISHALTKKPIGEPQKDKAFYQGRRLETITFSGHGNPVSGKLYNKTQEIIQRSQTKTWFYDLWKHQGWDGKETVWRVEFSLEREGLHEMQLDDVYEVLRNSKRIWAYCTQDWLRMVVPGRSRNRTRWATHPTWTLIQRAFDDEGCRIVEALGPLVRERQRARNIEQGVAAIAGYATTLAAWCEQELEDASAEDIFSLVYEKVIERWEQLRLCPQDMVAEKKIIYHLVG